MTGAGFQPLGLILASKRGGLRAGDRRTGRNDVEGFRLALGIGNEHFWQRLEQEQNRLFVGVLDTPNLWIWESIFSGSVASYPFQVSRLAESFESGKLELWLQGVSGPEVTDAHRLRLYVNGTLVAEPS